MKRIFYPTSMIVVAIFLILALSRVTLLDARSAPETAQMYQFVGGAISPSPTAAYWGEGLVYPSAFDANDPQGLTIIFHDVNMSQSRKPLPSPLFGACPIAWPSATSRAYFAGGVTNDASIGPLFRPNTGVWNWLFNTGYYLGQTFYNPGSVGDQPVIGIETPYLQVNTCGWNGPAGNDPAYDTFDLRMDFQVETGSGALRVIPYIRMHASTVPSVYPVNTWLPWGAQGNCSLGQGCRDIPAGKFDFTRLKPYVMISNGAEYAGGTSISWSSVEVIGAPNIDEAIRGCPNGGWMKYLTPAFQNELECIFHFSSGQVFLPLVKTP
jgi:hypothetical protein